VNVDFFRSQSEFSQYALANGLVNDSDEDEDDDDDEDDDEEDEDDDDDEDDEEDEEEDEEEEGKRSEDDTQVSSRSRVVGRATANPRGSRAGDPPRSSKPEPLQDAPRAAPKGAVKPEPTR
jgi:hypothetical protein